MVAFGPALVLDFVPTKKVDVGDMANAGSQSGKASKMMIERDKGGKSKSTPIGR